MGIVLEGGVVKKVFVNEPQTSDGILEVLPAVQNLLTPAPSLPPALIDPSFFDDNPVKPVKKKNKTLAAPEKSPNKTDEVVAAERLENDLIASGGINNWLLWILLAAGAFMAVKAMKKKKKSSKRGRKKK